MTYRCVPNRGRRTGSCTKTFPFYLCCISQSPNSCFHGSQSWGTPGTLWENMQPQPSPQPGSGALPVAAPAQSLVADGDIFPMATAVLEHQFPHPDAMLAPEEDRWQWLSSITGKYMYQRAVTMWMGKNQALDVDDSYQYPWNSRPLSMSAWSVWKVFVIGLKSHPNKRMLINEEALDALFRMWEASGHGMQLPGTTGVRRSTGPRFFFKDITAPDFTDDWSNNNVEPGQYKASLLSLLSFGTTITGGYKGSGKTKMIRATQQPADSLAAAVPRGDIPAPAHAAITGRNAPLFVIFDRGCAVLMKGAWPTIGLTSWLQMNVGSDAGHGVVRLWHRGIKRALHQFASVRTATPTRFPWLFHRADIIFSSSCQYFNRSN